MSEDVRTMRTVRKAAEEQGWRVERTGGDHLRWTPPDPRHSPVISGSTSSDWRAARNTVARLRQRGLRLDRREEKAMEVAVTGHDGGPPEGAALAEAPAEELFWCEDCGFGHPKREMALGAQGKPTRFCGKHLRERLSQGRQKQIARDRARQEDGAMTKLSASPADARHEEHGTDATGEAGVPEDHVKELMRAEVEILLSTLSDLEARMDRRLGAVEKGLENGHGAPASPAAVDLGETLLRFAQQALWLGSFDDADLSPAQKQHLLEKASGRLAERLGLQAGGAG